MPDGPGDRTAASPAAFPDSPLSRVLRQPLILGLFLPVQSGGWSASLLPRTTDWRFDYNAALTKGPYSNDETTYPKGVSVSDDELAAVDITRCDFHGEWNYAIAPRSIKSFKPSLTESQS